MALTKPRAEIDALLTDAVAARGFELYGWEYLPQGKFSVLRIYIDQAGGVTLDDCGEASRQIGAVLDVEGVISGQYTLEVSSPGLDRPLYVKAHYEQHVGEQSILRLQAPLADGRKKLTGTITAVAEDSVSITLDDGEVLDVPLSSIAKANLVPTF